MSLCGCGCGQPVKEGKKYIFNHYWIGKHRSEATKKKIGRANKSKLAGDKNPSKMPEVREKIRLRRLRDWQNPEYRSKMIEAQRRFYLNGGKSSNYGKHFSDNHRKKIFKAWNKKPNKLERELNAILQKYFPNGWKYNGDLSCGVIIGGLIPDFININGRKMVIELFGEYWHTGKKVKNRWKSTEFGRKAVYSQLGYDCVVIWDYELDDISNVIEKITENFGKTA